VLQTACTLERAPALTAPSAVVPPKAPSQRSVPIEEVTRPTQEALHMAARHIEDFVRSVGRNLSFSVDDSTGYAVVRVTDPETGVLIRQLPDDETLRISRAIGYMQEGMLVDQRA
jgi:flagellar protein FlaG